MKQLLNSPGATVSKVVFFRATSSLDTSRPIRMAHLVVFAQVYVHDFFPNVSRVEI